MPVSVLNEIEVQTCVCVGGSREGVCVCVCGW